MADFRDFLEKAKETVRSVADEVEKRLLELKDKLDQDKDGRPDVVERALEEAKKALEEAKARLKELDQDQDGLPDGLKSLAEAAKKAAETAKAKAEEAARLLRERLGRD
ncbi:MULTISPECIES: dolichyl-phosphate-mannose-protein mannosyltransferase [Thermus]|uniref:dolichyl-phosphate-mannose-protein mannosyltransferase n=1 Tax=Thermus TaxID=270 RepID=UPI001F44849D|nr:MULTISPECIES: dolichyl-phosphate-mannose-protein mannosyltransferase [Thermus]